MSSPRTTWRHKQAQPNAKRIQIDAESSHDRRDRLREVAEAMVVSVRGGRISVPMLPRAATEALAVANDPGVSLRVLERVVGQDPLIAAKVLAVANSAAYGGNRVRSLGRALSRLGAGTIRDVLYQAVAECHVFRGDAGRALRDERDHAVAVAQLAKLVCGKLGVASDDAFVCGLLHDIGRTITLELASREHQQLKTDELGWIADRIHGPIGAHVAAAWQLPALVAEACRKHHRYKDPKTGEYSQMGNIVAVADRLAAHCGAGRPARPIEVQQEPCLFDLGLSVDGVEELLAACGEQLTAA